MFVDQVLLKMYKENVSHLKIVVSEKISIDLSEIGLKYLTKQIMSLNIVRTEYIHILYYFLYEMSARLIESTLYVRKNITTNQFD